MLNGHAVDLYAFSDADWAGDTNNQHYTSEYVFKVADSTTSWCSKKQSAGAKSSTEVEYVALSQEIKEAISLQKLLADLDYKAMLNEDNQGTLEIPMNPRFHNRTRHIDVTFHFICERFASNEINEVYCPSSDIMTKGLTKEIIIIMRCDSSL